MHKKITLPNKLRAILLPSSESHSVAVSIHVKAGTRFEEKKTNGIAHFLEHLGFKGTKDFKNEFELAKFVEGFGGKWNAYTDEEEIGYFIRSEASHLKDIIYSLDQVLFHPTFNTADIEKEKGVITEEFNMFYDVPEHKVSILLDELTWPDNPLGRFGVGTKETIKSFRREDFLAYSGSFLSPNNIVIGISGKFDEKEAKDLVSEYFDELESKENPEYDRVLEVQTKPRFKVDTRESEQSHIALNFKGVPKDDKRFFALKTASCILGGGASSRLFQKIRSDMGLAYYVSAFSRSYMDTGAFSIVAGLNNKNCPTGVSEILKEVKNLVKNGVTDEEIKRNTEFQKSHVAIRLEDHQAHADFIVSQELKSKEVLTYDEYIKGFNSVTKAEVGDTVAELLTPETLNLAVVGSVKEDVIKSVVEGAI